MNTMKTSMQLALEALSEIRERLEMVEPVFPKLGTQLDIIEAQIHIMGCELNVRESYPIDAVSDTGAKIQRIVEDFEAIIHEKCLGIWALVVSVEREKWSPADLAVEMLEITRVKEIMFMVWRSHMGASPDRTDLVLWSKRVRDEAENYYRRKYEEEEATNVQRRETTERF